MMRRWGLWIYIRPVWPGTYVKTPWGHLSIKLKRDMLFSERYGYTPTRTLGPICFAWRSRSALFEIDPTKK